MGQLNNLYISSSYQGLLKLTDSTQGLTNTLQTVQSGNGTDSPLQISNNAVNISGSFTINNQPISVDTGSFATTGSNTFVGEQFITGSNGYISLDGTSNADVSLQSIHANDDQPWIARFYNDTFSDTNSVMSYWGFNDGRFVMHNDTTQSMTLGINGYNANNLVIGDTNTISNRDLIISGAIKTNGAITFSESAFNSTTNVSGALYFSSLNNGTLHLNDDGGEGDVFIGWGPNNTHIRGNTDITGSLGVTNIKGTGSLFLQPDQSDVRYVEVYNTSPTDTHITASGGQIFLGDDVTYVKVDNYGSVERIDIVAGNELVVSSSIVKVTGSLHQSGTFYPDVIDWFSSSIVQGTGSYVLTTDLLGVTQYDTYQNVASALQPFINTGSFSKDGLITTGSIATTQSITGSLVVSGSNTFIGSQAIYGNQNNYVQPGQNSVSLILQSGSVGGQHQISFGVAPDGSTGLIFQNKTAVNTFQTNGELAISNNIGGDGTGSITFNIQTGSLIIKSPNTRITGSLNVSGSQSIIGPVNVTGSVNISGSLQVKGDITSVNIVNNIIGRTMVYGGDGGAGGATPRLIISGSDGANTSIGRSFYNNDSTMVNGLNSGMSVYGAPNTQTYIGLGVYTPDTFEDDYELNILTSSGGTQFQDFDNFNTFGYQDFLVIPPNVGNSPAPQFPRGLGVTGSLKVSGNVMFASGSNKTMGTVALNGGNPGSATISNTLVTTSSLIFLTKQTNNHPNAGPVVVSSKGSGTFTITSNHNGDTDTVAYQIINPS